MFYWKGNGGVMSEEQHGAPRLHTVAQWEWDGFATIARLDNEPGMDRCIRSAYLDLSRTLTGMATFPDAQAWHRFVTAGLKSQLEMLTRRSTWSCDEFDAWHRMTTIQLIKTAGDLHFPLTVGQAQKWVNMSIKNEIALGSRLSPNLSCVYDVAHVALDQIVLTGLRQKKSMPRQLVRGPWSKLPDYEEYMRCQRWIREELPGIPIEEEFRLWEEGRGHISTPSTAAAEVQPALGLPVSPSSLTSQVVGNAGLYFVCYKLSLLGWNVMPTARNARGVDILAYSQDAKLMIAVQVKSLGKRNLVPIGGSLDGIMGDFWVIVDRVRTDQPRAFILLPSEVGEMAHRNKSGDTASFWLEPPMYDQDAFREAWMRIGRGDAPGGV
jgi:hypothetical protein